MMMLVMINGGGGGERSTNILCCHLANEFEIVPGLFQIHSPGGSTIYISRPFTATIDHPYNIPFSNKIYVSFLTCF